MTLVLIDAYRKLFRNTCKVELLFFGDIEIEQYIRMRNKAYFIFLIKYFFLLI